MRFSMIKCTSLHFNLRSTTHLCSHTTATDLSQLRTWRQPTDSSAVSVMKWYRSSTWNTQWSQWMIPILHGNGMTPWMACCPASPGGRSSPLFEERAHCSCCSWSWPENRVNFGCQDVLEGLLLNSNSLPSYDHSHPQTQSCYNLLFMIKFGCPAKIKHDNHKYMSILGCFS